MNCPEAKRCHIRAWFATFGTTCRIVRDGDKPCRRIRFDGDPGLIDDKPVVYRHRARSRQVAKCDDRQTLIRWELLMTGKYPGFGNS